MSERVLHDGAAVQSSRNVTMSAHPEGGPGPSTCGYLIGDRLVLTATAAPGVVDVDATRRVTITHSGRVRWYRARIAWHRTPPTGRRMPRYS